MMLQLEQRLVVWVGGQRRRDLLLTHAEPQSLGVPHEPTCRSTLPSSSFHCAALLERKVGRPMHVHAVLTTPKLAAHLREASPT